MNVARAVRKHLANVDDDDELRFGEGGVDELGGSMRAVPFTRSRFGEQRSMNSMPTCRFAATLPIDRYMPLPS